MSTDFVSLVVPGRNTGRTIRQCPGAVMPFLGRTRLRESIFADDGSTGDTAAIVAECPVTLGSWVDHVPPPLAMLALVSTPLLFLEWSVRIAGGLVGFLMVAQVPKPVRLLRHLRRLRRLCCAAMNLARAFPRGISMTPGLFRYLGTRPVRSDRPWQ